jgi:hypothetical protein
MIKKAITLCALCVCAGPWGSAYAGEATIEQLGGTIRGAIERINAAALSSQASLAPNPSTPSFGPADVGPGLSGNVALTSQQGSNNLAAITQIGHGNFSLLSQSGTNNAAIVLQSRH